MYTPCFDFNISEKDMLKYLALRPHCLFNPCYDYPLLYPSEQYPRTVVSPMIIANHTFSIKLNLAIEDSYKVNVLRYNEYYPSYMSNVQKQYRFIFGDLKKYIEEKKSKIRIIEFFKHYVETSNLDNVFCETDFIIKNDVIIFSYDKIYEFVNICEFLIDGYKVNCSAAYMFFEDLLTRQQYMYYGD